MTREQSENEVKQSRVLQNTAVKAGFWSFLPPRSNGLIDSDFVC